MANLNQFVTDMNESIDAFMHQHGIAKEGTGGFYDANCGAVVYFDAKDPKDKTKHKAFSAVFAGTYNDNDGSFIWAWGNKHLPPSLSSNSAMTSLKAYGEKHEVPEFVERCLLLDASNTIDFVNLGMTRQARNFKDGFDAQVSKDETGALYSRFTTPELFAVITKILSAHMSSNLPVVGSSLRNTVFIQDPEPLTNPEFDPGLSEFLGLTAPAFNEEIR